MDDLRKSADILRKLASGITYTDEQMGLLGKLDSDGTVNPNPSDGLDKPYVWVRLNDTDQAVRAINMNTTSRIPNLRVRVARDRKMKEWVILGLAPEIVHELPEQAPTYNTPDRISDLITELVDLNRLRGLRVKRGSTTFRVVAENGYYWWQGEFRAWLESNDELDISGDVPGGYGTKRPVLIGIDPDTNTLTSYAGDVVVVTLPPVKGKMFTPDLIEAAVQAAPTNIRWIACIPLASNDTDWSDPYRVTALQYIPIFDSGQYTLVRVDDVDQTERGAINFISGTGINISGTDDAGDNETEVLVEAVPSAILDYKVKVSSNDTTADYLFVKLAAGNGITLTETNDGGDEDATIAVDESQLSLANLGTRAFVNLSDVPSVYTSHGSKLVRVNAGATGLEFVSQNNLISLEELSDVSISLVTNKMVLQHNGTNWDASFMSLSEIESVSLSSLTNGDAFYYNSGWTNGDVFVRNTGDTIQVPASSGTVIPSLTITPSAHTLMTAGTERHEVAFNFNAASKQFNGGTFTNQREFFIRQPSYTGAVTTTITNVATVAIENAPSLGANMSVTNGYALWVQGGNTRLDGQVQINNLIVIGDTRNIQVGSGTGTIIGTASTQKLGFWGTTAVVRSSGWSSTGHTPDKALNTTDTLADVINVLGTLIEQLKTYGLLGA